MDKRATMENKTNLLKSSPMLESFPAARLTPEHR